jgi:hypothetical protein
VWFTSTESIFATSFADLVQPGARIVQQDVQFDHFVGQLLFSGGQGLFQVPSMQTVDINGVSLNGDPGLRMKGLDVAGFSSLSSSVLMTVTLQYNVTSLVTSSLLHDMQYNFPIPTQAGQGVVLDLALGAFDAGNRLLAELPPHAFDVPPVRPDMNGATALSENVLTLHVTERFDILSAGVCALGLNPPGCSFGSTNTVEIGFSRTTVPEPTTLILAMTGFLALWMKRRRRTGR